MTTIYICEVTDIPYTSRSFPASKLFQHLTCHGACAYPREGRGRLLRLCSSLCGAVREHMCVGGVVCAHVCDTCVWVCDPHVDSGGRAAAYGVGGGKGCVWGGGDGAVRRVCVFAETEQVGHQVAGQERGHP